MPIHVQFDYLSFYALMFSQMGHLNISFLCFRHLSLLASSSVSGIRPVSLRKGLSIVRCEAGESLNQQCAVAKANSEKDGSWELSTCFPPLPCSFRFLCCNMWHFFVNTLLGD